MISLGLDDANGLRGLDGQCFLPVKLDIYADTTLDDPDDDDGAYGELLGLILGATGSEFCRIGTFSIRFSKRNTLFSNLAVSKSSRWIKRIGDEGRRKGLFKPRRSELSELSVQTTKKEVKAQFWSRFIISIV